MLKTSKGRTVRSHDEITMRAHESTRRAYLPTPLLARWEETLGPSNPDPGPNPIPDPNPIPNHWEQEETLSNLSPAEQLKQIDVSLTLTLALTLT